MHGRTLRWLIVGFAVLIFPAVLAFAEWEAGSGAVPTALARALRHGDRGDQVTALQRLLEHQGFSPGQVDGIFGPLTEGAVRRAQAALNLEVDGLAGSLTLGGLQGIEHPVASASGAPATLLGGSQLVLYRAGSPGGPAGPAAATATGLALGPATGLALGPAPGSDLTAVPFSLTFNGSPEPSLLPDLLAMLDRHRMQATFFITGRMATVRPELVRRIAEAGHEIGSAGYESIDMTRLTPEMQRAQLLQTRTAIQEGAGVAPRFFRPPQGRFSAGLVQTAAGLEQRTALWSNVFAADLGTPEATARVLEMVQPGAVILLHQDRYTTVLGLDRLLTDIKSRGFASVGLSRLPSCETCR